MHTTFRDNFLDGKTALITGGGSGIGLGIAEALGAAGVRVVLVGRNQERLDEAVAHLREQGRDAHGFSADVRDYDQLAAVTANARETVGHLDIVIAGAAGNFPAPSMGMSANGFKAVVDIDLNGTFNTFRAAFEHLRTPGANLIAISAPQAFLPTPFQAHVCAAKAGVDQLIRTVAMEIGGAGVRVNGVCPGPVNDTEGMARLTPTDESRETLINSIPMGRYVEKSEVADAVLFLCSDAARMITGTVIAVDGGSSLPGSGAWMSAFA